MKSRYDVSAEMFIKTWAESSSIEEVSEKLGMPKAIVSARASGYRAVGIPLKRMKRIRQGLDVEALKQLLEAEEEQDDSAESVVRNVIESLHR